MPINTAGNTIGSVTSIPNFPPQQTSTLHTNNVLRPHPNSHMSHKRRRRLEDRRDSFYFLQRSVERRAARRAASRLSTEDGEWSADRFWSQDPRSPRFAPAAMGWTNRNTATGGSRGGGGLEESLRGEMNKREGARGGRWADERSKRAFEPDLIASRDKAYRAN